MNVSPPVLFRPRWLQRASALAAASACAAGLSGGNAWALPQGAQLVFGKADVQTPSTQQMNIVQSTDRAGLDWTQFTLGTGELLTITQPTSSSVLFNRVLGPDPSKIHGQISANGRVFLSNPRGVVFGEGSQVDVGALVATTLDWGDNPGTRVSLQLAKNTFGTPGVVQQLAGSRIQSAGTVALVGPQVEQAGEIVAPRVGLAATERVSVDLDGDGLIFFDLGADQLDVRLKQLGRIQADGGLVDLRAQARAGVVDAVLNLDGVVQARSLSLRQGRIHVDGGGQGRTEIQGQLDATGGFTRSTGTVGSPGSVDSTLLGGNIGVYGTQIQVGGTALMDASGAAGGGTVSLGQAPANIEAGTTAMAQTLQVSAGALLQAHATQTGHGGRIVAGSSGLTQFAGSLLANGGPQGLGNGGSAELSGGVHLGFEGQASLGATQGGQRGLLRLTAPSLRLDEQAASAAEPVLRWQALKDSLGMADVWAQSTTGDILIGGSVSGLPAAGALRLVAANNVAFDPSTRLGDAAAGDIFNLEINAAGQMLTPTGLNGLGVAAISTLGQIKLRAGGTVNAPALRAANVGIEAGDGISLRGRVEAPGGLALKATTGQVRQDAGADVRASTLSLQGGADHVLTNAGNRAQHLEVLDAARGLHYVNSGTLHLGAITSQLDGWIRAQASSDTDLSADQRAGNLWLGGPIQAGNALGLMAAGAVGQDANTRIQAQALSVRAQRDIWLGGANQLYNFSADSAQGGVYFRDTAGFDLGGMGASVGRVMNANGELGEAVFIGAQGLTALAAPVTLRAEAGRVDQQDGAALRTPALTLLGGADFNFHWGGNQVGQLSAGEGGGALSFVNAQALTLAGLDRRTGTSQVGDVAVRSLGGGLHVNGPITANQVLLEAQSDVTQSGQTGAIAAAALGVRSNTGDILLGADAGNRLSQFAAYAPQGQVLLRAQGGYLLDALPASTATVRPTLAVASAEPVFRGTEGWGVFAAGTVQLDTREVAGNAAPLDAPRMQPAAAASDTLATGLDNPNTVGQSDHGGIQAGALLLTGRGGYTLTQAGLNRVDAFATQAEGSDAGAVDLTLAQDVSLRALQRLDGPGVALGLERTAPMRLQNTGRVMFEGAVRVDSNGQPVQIVSHFDAPTLPDTAAALAEERAYLGLRGAANAATLPLSLRADAIGQRTVASGLGAGEGVSQGSGTALHLVSTRNASITLGSAANQFGAGTLSARSGDFSSATTVRLTPLSPTAALSRITLAGSALSVGDSGARVDVPGYDGNSGSVRSALVVGLEADLIRLAAPVVRTQSADPLRPAAAPYLIARLAPTAAGAPAARQLPSLVLALPSLPAGTSAYDLGQSSQAGLNTSGTGDTQGLRVLLGLDPATRTGAGWMLVTPDAGLLDTGAGRAANQALLDSLRALSTPLYLSGPVAGASGGYQLLLPGQTGATGSSAPVAVYYNLAAVLPPSPPSPEPPTQAPVPTGLAGTLPDVLNWLASAPGDARSTGSDLASLLAQGLLVELSAAPLGAEGSAEAIGASEACDPAPGDALSCEGKGRSESIHRDLRDKTLLDVGKAGSAASGKAELRGADTCDAAGGQATGCEAPRPAAAPARPTAPEPKK